MAILVKRSGRLTIGFHAGTAFSAEFEMPLDIGSVLSRKLAIDPSYQFSRDFTHCISPLISSPPGPPCLQPWRWKGPALLRFPDNATRRRAAGDTRVPAPSAA